MVYEPSGKWATEAFDFLRLFQRIGKSLTGLILLEAAFGAYLLLVLKLTGSRNGFPALQFSVPWLRLRALQGEIYVPITTTYLVGALFVFVCWLFYSGLHRYLIQPFRVLFKAVLAVVLVALMIALFALSALAMPITWPLETFLTKRFAANPSNKDKLSEVRKSSGDKGAESYARRHVAVHRTALLNEVGPMLGALWTWLISSARIGVAAIQPYSYSEDLQAAKIPLQVFATASARLEIKLQNLRALEWIRFISLPASLKVATAAKAKFVRRWFGLDVLLWGSFLGSKSDQIWLNILQIAHEEQATEKEEEQFTTSSDTEAIFPWRLTLNVPAVTLSITDPSDAYIVVAVALMVVLDNRKKRRAPLASLDKLSLTSARINDILERLAVDTILGFPNLIIEDEVPPSAKALMLNVVGNWIGSHLMYWSDDKKLPSLFDQFAKRMLTIAMKCADLRPMKPEGVYRVAALQCLLNDDEAFTNLKAAGELDASQNQIDPYSVSGWADFTFSQLKVYSGSLENQLLLARFVCYATRVLYIGDKGLRDNIDHLLEQAVWLELERKTFNKEPFAIQILRRIISERKTVKAAGRAS